MPATHILVVDDDPDILSFMDVVLTESGYNVVTAADGAAALRMLEKEEPNLILLDMRMPIMDGWEFARAYLTQARDRPPAPIVVCTAAENAREWAAQINAQAYLSKPFGLDELLAIVKRFHTP